MRAIQQTDDHDRRVHVHLHVPEHVRRAIRLVAASRGTTIAEEISKWALREAHAAGLSLAPAGV